MQIIIVFIIIIEEQDEIPQKIIRSNKSGQEPIIETTFPNWIATESLCNRKAVDLGSPD